MNASLQHPSLRSILKGAEGGRTLQFRGIPYGRIPKRFAAPEPVESLGAELNCTQFGPRCPQVPIDVGHLLRLPADQALPTEPDDEFGCLNLDVVVPQRNVPVGQQGLPVLFWIHGGSQAVTFGSAASGVCDMTKIVTDSLELEKPIIAVSIQYRLNIFAFGDEDSTPNLALQDQALALEWVRSHIAGFGGDPENITVAGESAGAVYCHAHLVARSPARQFILSSGSLHLSPPQPPAKAQAFRSLIKEQLKRFDNLSIGATSSEILVEAVKRSGIQSWFLQEDQLLTDWKTSVGDAQRLLIGDVQNEAVLWREGVYAIETAGIVRAFDLAAEASPQLKKIYNIYPDRPASCKIGALEFINDYKFALPVNEIVEQWHNAKKPAFRYLIDETNPWQTSNGAHHGIDLVLLFGGFDLSFSPSADATGKNMRKAWIEFISGEDPCAYNASIGFGPYGGRQELDDAGVRARRRIRQVEYMQGVDRSLLDSVFASLAAGRISLLN